MPDTATVPRRATHLPRPTRSAALLLLLAIILELLGRLIKSGGVTIAAAAALGAILGDAVLIPRLDGFIVSRLAPDRMTAGISASIRLTATAPTGRFGARRSVVLIDDHPALPIGRIVTPGLGAGQSASADREATPPARGFWPAGGTVTVESFSPLGGFVRRHTLSLTEPCWVHPAPATTYRLPEIHTGRALGTSASPRSGPGSEFFGIREWRNGDPAAAIHWRASARRSQLVVMERERPAHTALVVWCGRPASDAAVWEKAIARAAATAVLALRSGRTVTLVVGSDVTVAQSSVEILDWYAALDPTHLPDPGARLAAVRTAGSGATVLWLGADPVPTALTATPSIGAVVSAIDAGTTVRR